MLNLYKHQQQLLDKNPHKHLLAWGTGVGKTITALSLAKKNKQIALIICPKSIKQQWFEQITKGNAVLSKEEFRKVHQRTPKYNCLIVDESHYFFGPKSGLTKSLLWYLKKYNPEYIYLLTATPYMSTPWNIYTAAQILGKTWNWWEFKNKFFTDIRMGQRIVPIVRPHIQTEIARLVNFLGSTVKLEDCIDMPPQIFQQEYFDLTKEQKKAIEDIKNTESNHLVKWTKIHQICGGTLKGDGYTEDKEFDSEKIKRIKELALEHHKLVIIARYNHELEVLKEVLKGYKTSIINGSVQNRHEIIQEAEKSSEYILLINAACSEGYQLPSFPLMIFYSYDFSLKNYIQIVGRINRIDHPKKNVYLSLIVKGTIDEDVFKCVQNKKDFQIAIYDSKLYET